MKKIRLILWALVAIATIIFAVGSINKSSSNNTPAVAIKNFGGDFELTNHLSNKVTQSDFDNQYRLIYFGFTYCPAICPTELQRISSVLKQLGDAGKTIQPIFITVDPQRDTIDVMKEYVSLFHPRLIGLTGTPEQIDTVKKAYKIYAKQVQEEGMNDYTMDHSSFIYFINSNNDLVRIFKTDDSVDHMISVINKHMTK